MPKCILARAAVLSCALLLLLLTCARPGAAEPIDKSRAKSKKVKKAPVPTQLYSHSYAIADIVAKGSNWRLGASEEPAPRVVAVDAAPVRGNDRIVAVLLETIPELRQGALGPDATIQLRIVNYEKLEVVASAKVHEQIVDVLETIRRLQDQALSVSCWLYEVERAAFDKDIAPRLLRLPGEPAVYLYPGFEDPVTDKVVGKPFTQADHPFARGPKPLTTSKTLIQDRAARVVLSWRSAIAFERGQGHVFLVKEVALAHAGFSVKLKPTISADRRSAQIALTQQATQLAGWKKENYRQVIRKHANVADMKAVSFNAPVLRDSSTTSTFTVADGQPFLVPVHWRDSGEAAKNRQLVLVAQPLIYIEEEEKMRRESEKEKK